MTPAPTIDEYRQKLGEAILKTKISCQHGRSTIQDLKLTEELKDWIIEQTKALIAQSNKEAERRGRVEKLQELNLQIAQNGWHKDDAYKMFPYINSRYKALKKANNVHLDT